MTNATRPFSHHLASAFLALGTALAAANWYLQPARAASWAITLLVMGGMALVLLLIGPRYARDTARESASKSIRSGVAFAGFMLAVSLAAKLATVLGAATDDDLARRTRIDHRNGRQ